jgi:FkbM family methyltransferase
MRDDPAPNTQCAHTLLDIGANIGYYSAVFLANVQNGHAICIEPQPGIVELLTKNMGQFGDRAEVHPVGLAEKSGRLRFSVDEKSRGRAHISKDGKVEIKVVEARQALKELDRVDLIKIDVEGFEEPVLCSAQEEIGRLRPRAIVFEDHTGGASPDGKIGAVLSSLGYRIFGIDKRLLKTVLVPIHLRTECRFNDYIALI